jgi:phage-related protein|tara:strand:+ start:177 stop:1166 length:990 start_codon:yes stop_codon:yes gene_type:complete
MAIAAWAASTAFSVGNVRRSTGDEGTGLFFRCTTAGTSASSEPEWPNSAGDTVTDGTCVWTAISATYGDLAISNPSAIIELFQLRLDSALHGSNDIYYFHAGSNEFGETNIVFDTQVYSRVPIKADGFEYSNTGTLPRPTLTVSNLSSTITALLLLVNATTAGNDLGGAEVRRIRTLAKYLDSENFGEPKNAITQGNDSLVTQGDDNLEFNDVVVNATADPNARFPDERWFIDRKSSETRDSVTFELASKFDLAGQKIPRRQVIANICQWKYRSSECSYTGTDYYDVNGNEVSTEAQDVCGKRVASCKLRFGENAELPFGSFPGAGLTK